MVKKIIPPNIVFFFVASVFFLNTATEAAMIGHVEQDNLKIAQQQESYQRIFPSSVSPKPDSTQTRDAREAMEQEVKEKQKMSAEQEEPLQGKPVRATGEPTELYYKISVDDKLYISVWRVPDLSLEFVVGPDGHISFPLIGDVLAAGKTLAELDVEITEKLKEYVIDPQVAVIVREFAGDQVTVIGEVRNPGIYKFIGKTRIMDVIAQAQGFTDRAKSASIVIVRESEDPTDAKENLMVVDIKSILKGKLKNNIEIQPYDIIYVSRTFVSNAKEFYDSWIIPTVDSVIDYETFKSLRKTRHRLSDDR